MVALGFTVASFDTKIPLGQKLCTTRKFSLKRYQQFKQHVPIQLYWKMRTKECHLLGVSLLDELYAIDFTFHKENPSCKPDEDLSIITTKGHYAVYVASDPTKPEWYLVTEEFVQNYIHNEGVPDIDFLFEWLMKQHPQEDDFFFVIKWKYPLYLPAEKPATATKKKVITLEHFM